MEGINARAYVQQNEIMEKAEARSKMPYRISIGQAYLDDEKLNEKWANFVKKATEGFGHGVLLDETLHIMGMIKAGVPMDKIRESLSKIDSNKTVVDYLRAFIKPEIVSKLELDNDKDIEIQDL